MLSLGHYIAGEFIYPNPSDSFTVLSPYGDELARAAQGNLEDLEAAVSAAKQGYKAWRGLSCSQKEDLFFSAAEALADLQGDLVEALIEETGSTIGKAQYELDYSRRIFRVAAGEIRRLYGETIPAEALHRRTQVVREPIGVVGVISPFNAPLALLTKMFVFPLAAGNALLVKPSEYASMVSWKLMEVLHQVGFPPGVINMLTGQGATIGAALVAHPDVAGITFTGSTHTGKVIAAAAAPAFKRLHLELGGNNAVIVCADFDVAEAARKVAMGAFFHSGQICMASSRILVEKAVYDKFIKELHSQVAELRSGDLRDPLTAISPLINGEALARVEHHTQVALDSGGTLVCGGRRLGPQTYAPTVIVDAAIDCLPWQEETFGPLCLVNKFDGKEEGLAMANNSRYGLSAGVLTYDIRLADYFCSGLDVGAVHVGSHSFHSEPMSPLGGERDSGVGRSGGKYSTEHFLKTKWISTEVSAGPYPQGF